MINERNKYLLSQQLTGEISDLEKEELEKILDEDAELAAFTEAFDAHNRQINVRKRIDEYRKQQALKKKWLKVSLGGLGIAASLALVYFFFFKTHFTEVKGNQLVAFRISAQKDSLTILYQGKDDTTLAVGNFSMYGIEGEGLNLKHVTRFNNHFILIDSLENKGYAAHIADLIESEKTTKRPPVAIIDTLQDKLPLLPRSNKDQNKQKIAKNSVSPNKQTLPLEKQGSIDEKNIKPEKKDEIAYQEFGKVDESFRRITRGTNTGDGKDTFSIALDSLDKKAYKSVIKMLLGNNQSKAHYFLGIAYFMEKQYQNAEKEFLILNDKDYPFETPKEDVEWKLLICYLAQPSKKKEFNELRDRLRIKFPDKIGKLDSLLEKSEYIDEVKSKLEKY